MQANSLLFIGYHRSVNSILTQTTASVEKRWLLSPGRYFRKDRKASNYLGMCVRRVRGLLRSRGPESRAYPRLILSPVVAERSMASQSSNAAAASASVERGGRPFARHSFTK